MEQELFRPIEDYAAIGNCRALALVSRQGAVDWLCLPRFDSESIFGAILDRRKGGRFVLRPAGFFSVSRRYEENTNLLVTEFSTSSGRLRLLDLMPVASEEEKGRMLWPDHHLLRIARCLEGEVELEALCEPRPGFGRITPKVENRKQLGFWIDYRDQVGVLLSNFPLSSTDRGVEGREKLRAGDERIFSLTFAHGEPAVIPPLEAQAGMVEISRRWWKRWAKRCAYEGPYREMVLRSLLALKLLTYAPSGAVVAAPTTSLPEAIGGRRNYDYRYCWLRDASWTLRAFFDLGYPEEARAFLQWLLHATRLSWPQLQTVYDVHGETDLTETTLEHLEGYRGSRPVRVGNRAVNQFQLDIYGELILTAYEFVQRGGELDRAEARMLSGLGKTVMKCWRRPDKGIWEMPGKPRPFTYSKGMAWVALDRLLALHEEGRMEIDAEKMKKERENIREVIESQGFSQRLNSYVGTLGGEELDSALLQLGIHGVLDPKTPRMQATFERIRRELMDGPLLRRYPSSFDDLPSTEAPFGICGFWVVQFLLRQGKKEAAREEFERLSAFGNDVGLFSEEIDSSTGAFRGNFPQAFTHVGLINAALALERVEAGDSPVRGRKGRG